MPGGQPDPQENISAQCRNGRLSPLLTMILTESKEVTWSRARQGYYYKMIYKCMAKTILHKTRYSPMYHVKIHHLHQ